jgi:hypothetical protein
VGSYHRSVTDLRVTVPEETAECLAREAADRGTSAEDVAAEVPRLHAPQQRGNDRFGFIGIARRGPVSQSGKPKREWKTRGSSEPCRRRYPTPGRGVSSR